MIGARITGLGRPGSGSSPLYATAGRPTTDRRSS